MISRRELFMFFTAAPLCDGKASPPDYDIRVVPGDSVLNSVERDSVEKALELICSKFEEHRSRGA